VKIGIIDFRGFRAIGVPSEVALHRSKMLISRLFKQPLSHWALAAGRGNIQHKVESPPEQLGQRPTRPGKAKRFQSPHPEGMGMGDHFLVIAVGPFTGAASFIEVMPCLGAALNRPNKAWMVFETHAVRVAQDAVAVGAALLLLGRTLQATDILPTLGLIVVAIGVT
jgi:hypothetical protein